STVIKDSSAGVSLSSSVLLAFISRLSLGDAVSVSHTVLLHPLAFAGWLGLMVTALNLLPIGQLDGGHIAYAILGERQRIVSIVMVPVLLALGFFGWRGWFVWAILVSMLGIRHPPIIDPEIPIDKRHRLLGLAALVMFAITFIPIPFSLS
ncbi:MAG: site-2 protease family protein, partial [Nitrospirota bacterium]